MRQPKIVFTVTDDYIENHSVFEIGELASLIEKYMEFPAYEEFKEQYSKSFARKRIARKRDANGTREVFSNNEKINPVYVNVKTATAKELAHLKKAMKGQSRQREQLDKNIVKISNKVRMRLCSRARAPGGNRF